MVKSFRKNNQRGYSMKGTLIGLIVVGLLCLYNISFADIYKYTDDKGIVHLTNEYISEPCQTYGCKRIMKEKRIPYQPNLSNIDENKYDDLIIKTADKYKLDSALIKAIIKAGSNFNPKAVSPVGAQGLMQLKPATASDLKIKDSFNPEQNIDGGARYLRYLLNTYKGDLTLALAAYNAGEKAVAKYNYNVPPYRESQNYVRRVFSFYKSYSLQ